MNLKRLKQIINSVPEEFDDTIVIFSDSLRPEIYNEVVIAKFHETHDLMGSLYTDDGDEIDIEQLNIPVFLITDE